jgi:hypothetical protein
MQKIMDTNLISFLFLKNEEVYACCECNSGQKAYALYTYYDQENMPHCKICFLKKIDELASRVMNGNSETYWQDGYRKLHKEYSYILRENEDLKNNVNRLVAKNLQLDYDLEVAKRQLDFLERQIS